MTICKLKTLFYLHTIKNPYGKFLSNLHFATNFTKLLSK